MVKQKSPKGDFCFVQKRIQKSALLLRRAFLYLADDSRTIVHTLSLDITFLSGPGFLESFTFKFYGFLKSGIMIGITNMFDSTFFKFLIVFIIIIILSFVIMHFVGNTGS